MVKVIKVINMKIKEKFFDNIYYITNIIEDPNLFLDSINKSPLPWKEWTSSSNYKTTYGNKKTFHPEDLESLNNDDKKNAQLIYNIVQKIIADIFELIIKDKELDHHHTYSKEVAFSKYIEKSSMGLHCDDYDGITNLKYSIVLYWNNDYDGGEISFLITDKDLRLKENSELRVPPDVDIETVKNKLDLIIKPEQASALVFPSNLPFHHQVHMIKSGERYISTAFILKDKDK